MNLLMRSCSVMFRTLPAQCKEREANAWVVSQFLLPKGPETARLLDDEEREWIIRRRTIGLEQAMREHPEKAKLIRESFPAQSTTHTHCSQLAEGLQGSID